MSTDDPDPLSSETAGWSTDDPDSTDEIPLEERPVPPKAYRIMAGVILVLPVLVPLVGDAVVGAVAVMGAAVLVLAMVLIEFGVPSGTLTEGLVGATGLALLGGLIVSVASLAGAVSGPLETALFWMAVCVGASAGFVGRIAMVAGRSAVERPS